MTEQNAAAVAAEAEKVAAHATAEAERLAAKAAEAREEAAKAVAAAEEAAGGAKTAKPSRRRKAITDIEVAAWLEDFQARSAEDQQASEVWQALAAFPQWTGAQYREDGPAAEMPINPRLTGEHLERELERRGEELPSQTLASAQKTDGSNAITTGAVGSVPNPWAEHTPPTESGMLFIAIDTPIQPPYPGNWRRKTGGWLREE